MSKNSVENFVQEEFFEDILPAMSIISGSRAQTPGSTAPSRKSPPKSPLQALRDDPGLPEFRVIRSSRRKRSMTAYRSNGIIEIHIPNRVSRKDEVVLIPEMIAMVLEREAKVRKGDGDLAKMANSLLAEHLPEFSERPASINWRSMRERWGSCTTADRTIRISDRLNTAPDYVIAYVLFHELIHLRIPDHGTTFYELLARAPEKERAEAFLEGYEAGIQGQPEAISLIS